MLPRRGKSGIVVVVVIVVIPDLIDAVSEALPPVVANTGGVNADADADTDDDVALGDPSA